MDQLRGAVRDARLTAGGGWQRASRALIAGLVLAMGIACQAGAFSTSGRALAQTFETPEDAASAVLAALAAKDVGRLQSLAVSEGEFSATIWPELPSSRPEVNLPLPYAWGTLQQNSQAGLAMTLDAHAGRRYRLQRVEAGPTVTRYASFVIHRDVVVVVEDPAGAWQRLRLFGSLLEQGGRWKIFSYVVD